MVTVIPPTESKGTLTNTTIGRYGRFANGLWQIMGLIGIAKEQGFAWAVPKWINWDHKERFGSTEEIHIYKHLVNPLPNIEDVNWPIRHYEWGYHCVQLPSGNQNITGHFQSPRYFMHAMDEIRHYLTFTGEPALSQQVAVHVRHGDYGSEYHPRLPLSYYEQAMALFPAGTEFLVFSDDLPAAQEMLLPLAEKYQLTLHPGVDYLADFKKMKRCHSFICANSSYSYAAALLADQPGKKMILPKLWFGPAWGDPEGMTRDLYHPEAIVI